ncbi:hypothetical protein F4692_001707 [Nocardioides cavernae]|uniref:Uncharacterized protein n=1 Tax=Nocardioides cavernae TaxID=1921566 RepID=A0A7Y9H257_9ACTN|nr:hypothetical protein [Nocardioides cavernae]NYE36574.1 hypothetical protein [Nocardioides cavernae]
MRAGTPVALALVLALAGCGGAGDPAPEQRSGQQSGEGPSGGPREAPTVVEPTDALLDWADTGHAAGTPYVRGPEWTAMTEQGGGRVVLAGDDGEVSISAGAGRTISTFVMSEDWAVVVRQDEAEREPSIAEVVDLATGETSTLAGPPPASGGSWALTGGDLYYPTYGDGRAYCLATGALADRNGEDGWCAPRRSGFSGLSASDLGVGIMTFDDARPVACRTANLLDGSGVPQPVEGPTACLAWDVAAAYDGYVWSEVPEAKRQEEAHFYASARGGFLDLGPGTTGSLTPCGDSVFFVRDPQSSGEPARLMRWTAGHTLEVAYESASVGNAFLGEPACAAGVLTLSSFGEQGDEQVWASVGE